MKNLLLLLFILTFGACSDCEHLTKVTELEKELADTKAALTVPSSDALFYINGS